MNHESGTYVSLELSESSRLLVDKFSTDVLCVKNPIDPSFLHTTVIYSQTPVPLAESLERSREIVAAFVRYEVFMTQTGRPCLTVILESGDARELNQQLTQWGATSRYDTYTPHLTLSYDFHDTIDGLPAIPFDLVYDKLIVKSLDVDFIPPSK